MNTESILEVMNRLIYILDISLDWRCKEIELIRQGERRKAKYIECQILPKYTEDIAMQFHKLMQIMENLCQTQSH